MGDRFVIRWPCEGHPSPLTPDDSRAWLEDTADGSEWFADGGQPEDMILCRDLKVFVDSMNKYDADLARVTAERDALRAEVEAMRELLAENWPCRCGHPLCKRCKHDVEVDDALRTRKVGG